MRSYMQNKFLAQYIQMNKNVDIFAVKPKLLNVEN